MRSRTPLPTCWPRQEILMLSQRKPCDKEFSPANRATWTEAPNLMYHSTGDAVETTMPYGDLSLVRSFSVFSSKPLRSRRVVSCHADPISPSRTWWGVAAIFLVGLCASLLIVGCGKKAVRTGVPFGLDKIPTEKKVLPQEDDWMSKGIQLAQEKKYEEALEAFKNLVLQEPENFSGFNALAVCHKNMGNHSEAMKNYDRALELADNSEQRAKILSNIGNLYFSAGKPQAALGFYKEAAATFEDNPLYLILIARTFVVLEEYDRAKKVLAQAEEHERQLDKYERDEDRGLGSYLMAYSYIALNDEEKVVKYLKKALKENPKKYISRIRDDLSDNKSLLFTLKDDPRLVEAIESYSPEAFLRSSFKR